MYHCRLVKSEHTKLNLSNSLPPKLEEMQKDIPKMTTKQQNMYYYHNILKKSPKKAKFWPKLGKK